MSSMSQPADSVKRERSILLPCPRCGDAQVAIRLDLGALDGDEALECAECEERFGLDEVRVLIERWAPVLAWIDQAPVIS